jgi:hypothetical protein
METAEISMLCHQQLPRMNAIAERWIGDTTVNSWTAL